ncbi:MAG: hypothetical protein ACLP7Q_25795 [Isosphaeraceae bacterium]
MRRWIKTLAGIGLTAACLMCAGCGGGNGPRASMKSAAASNSAPEPSTPPPAPAESKLAPAPVAAAAKPQPAPAVAAKEDKDHSGDEKQAAAGPSTPASKPDGGSSPAEVPAKATSNQPASAGGAAPSESPPVPANPAPPGGAAPAGSLGTQSQGQGDMPGGYPGMGNPGDMPGGYPGSTNPGGMPAGYPGAGEQTRGGGAAGSPGPGGMPAGYPGTAGQPGGYPGFPGPGGMTTGYPGMVGGGGPTPGAAAGGAFGATVTGRDASGANPNFGPADIHSPDGAVRSFLFALSIRDKNRLSEATALRSQTEAPSDKSKELFGKIVLGNISDAELDDIARKLDGYQVAGENAVHSKGKLGIIIRRRTAEGGFLSRTVTVRKEKKGWGVMDISSPIEFTPTGGSSRHRHTGTVAK